MTFLSEGLVCQGHRETCGHATTQDSPTQEQVTTTCPLRESADQDTTPNQVSMKLPGSVRPVQMKEVPMSTYDLINVERHPPKLWHWSLEIGRSKVSS